MNFYPRKDKINLQIVIIGHSAVRWGHKSTTHHQVGTMNVLEIMFTAWVCIEVTCCVYFLKSYEPVTEVEKILIFTFHSRGYIILKRVHNM